MTTYREMFRTLQEESYTLTKTLIEARREDWEAENIIAIQREITERTAARHEATRRLTDARQASGLSLEQAADAIGVSVWRYGVIERDPGLILADEALHVCQVLQVSPDVLYTLDTVDEPHQRIARDVADRMHEAVMDARVASA